MKKYVYRTEQFLPMDRDSAWRFFSSPENLALITPPEMHFRMLTASGDREIFAGMRLDYTVRPLWNIRLRWTTEIAGVDKPNRFKDSQVKGPYRIWEHEHCFLDRAGGTLMQDQVIYALRFGWLGRLLHAMLIRKKIRHIFAFRKKTLVELFGS